MSLEKLKNNRRRMQEQLFAPYPITRDLEEAYKSIRRNMQEMYKNIGSKIV